METTITTSNNAGNLTQPLRSAVFVPMDSVKGKTPAAGNRYCKLIKKGENSKLKESIAVEVPAWNTHLADVAAYDALNEYLHSCMDSLVDAYVKSRAITGALSVQYDEFALDRLNTFAAEYNASEGIGQLSEERISHWFDKECREIYVVALAEHLGISETATDAEVKRLEQLANGVRGNLMKLASKKPIMLDDAVRKMLTRALEITDTGDSMTVRLLDKLSQRVESVDLSAILGM